MRSPEHDYQQQLLKEVVKRMGIQAFLFDLDDTLIKTSEQYRQRIKIYAQRMHESFGLNVDEVYTMMSDAIKGLMDELHVHPRNPITAARLTAFQTGVQYDDPEVQRHLDEFLTIYDGTNFEAFNGAAETLHRLSGTSADLYLVTHGGEEYTRGKLRSTGLSGRFKQVVALDDARPKDVEAWDWAIRDRIGLTPQDVFVVGDSWKSDIRPVLELGVPMNRVIRIETSHFHGNRDLVNGVQQIESIAELIPTLLEKA